jgi:Bacterial Ig-like domain (group 2)
MKSRPLLYTACILGLLPLNACQMAQNAMPQPCWQRSDLKLRALPIGASMTMEIGMGQIMGSDCLNDPEAGKGWTWVTSDRTIATVTPTGIVTGIKPGTFSLKATKGNQTLEAQGFIMPKDWTVEFEPPAATVKVGESVKLKVVAYDANHQKLPPVPFSVYTPEFSHQEKEPLVRPWSQQQETNIAIFRANKPGVTQMIGKIEDKQVEMQLTITP